MHDHTTAIHFLRLHPAARSPVRASAGASGFDLSACLPDPPGYIDVDAVPVRVPTGIAIEFPFGLDVQIRPRSGLSARGVAVTLGTIDADYRGELLVTMYVFAGETAVRVQHGDRIAQLVVGLLAPVRFEETQALSDTDRGAGGHGSTGLR
jgi:dUTP pyrophosphatase